MATVGNLVVNLKANTASFSRGMNASLKKMMKFEKSTISLRGALAGLAGAAGFGYVAKQVFDLGASVEETASKFETVFGPAADGVQAFIDDFGVMAGLSQTAAKEIVATTGAIVQGMGLAQRASADYAEEVVRLAGDLTSFNDIPIEETAHAIQSAITGERESLKRLGIVILETDVQRRAMLDTGKEVAKQLTQEEKALATLALITERAGVAIGDLERTQESSANQARQLAADLQNLKETLATALMPVMGEFLTAIREQVGGLENLNKWVRENGNVITAWARVIVESMKLAALAIAAPLRLAFQLGQALGNLNQGKFRAMVEDMRQMGDIVMGVIDQFDDLRLASGEAWTEAANSVLKVTEAVKDFTRASEGAASGGAEGDGLLPGLQEFIDRAKEGGIVTKRLADGMPTLGNALITMSDGAALARGEISDLAQSMESTFSNAVTNVVLQTQSLADAFKSMVDAIIRELIRLQVQKFFIDTFTQVATAGAGGGVSAGSGSGGGIVDDLFGAAPKFGTVVNNNWNVSMIDTTGGEAFLKRHAGTIVGVVGDQARQSSSYGAVLRGS